MKYNYLLPLGAYKDKELFEFIGNKIKSVYSTPFRLLDNIHIPSNAYNRPKNQYNGNVLLHEISLLSFENINKIIAIINKDIYSDKLKFIFGIAESPGRILLVSTARLNPEFYGQKFNKDLFYERTLKEVLHEIGHNYNLSHCPDRNCAMYFSNTLADTDYKKTNYCEKCHKLIKIYNN